MNSFNGPVFLIGMPRSGTKLLRDLLNRHSRIAIPDVETEFLPWLVVHIGKFGDLSQPRNFAKFYDRVTKFSYFTLRKKGLRCPNAGQWHEACGSLDAAGVFEALIRIDVNAAPGSDVIWGDKSPSYIRHIPLIASLYHDARVIHIVRDVRDYCLSIKKAWGKDTLRAAQRWADDIMSARRTLESSEIPYAEVRYEALLADPECVLRGLCDLLELPFENCMLRLERSSENIGDAKGQTRIMSNNTGKFRERMSRQMLARIEEIAGDALVDYGYVLEMPKSTTRRLGRLEMLLAQLGDGWNLVRDAQRKGDLWKAILFHFRHFLTTRRL